MAFNVVHKVSTKSHYDGTLLRGATYTTDLENGTVFQLPNYITVDNKPVRGSEEVWTVTPSADSALNLWMAISPEVSLITDAMGNVYSMTEFSADPRLFTNIKGYVLQAVKLQQGDIIEMTGANITNIDTLEFLVHSGGLNLSASATAITDGMCLRKIKTSKLKIADGRLVGTATPVYKFEVVVN